MARNKTNLFIVVPSDTAPRATRLIKGTLKEVESRLRGEWEVRPASAEETHALHDVEIEDASVEPV